MISWESNGLFPHWIKKLKMGGMGWGGDWRQVGWPVQTHQAPKEGEECSEDEVDDEGKVNWAPQKALSLGLLHLPHEKQHEKSGIQQALSEGSSVLP